MQTLQDFCLDGSARKLDFRSLCWWRRRRGCSAPAGRGGPAVGLWLAERFTLRDLRMLMGQYPDVGDSGWVTVGSWARWTLDPCACLVIMIAGLWKCREWSPIPWWSVPL